MRHFKRLLFVFVFTLISGLMAQNGQTLPLGTTFKTAERTILSNSQDTTFAVGDTVWTGIISTSRAEGVFGITVDHDSVGAGTAATFDVFFREYFSAGAPGQHWGAWQTVETAAAMDSRTRVQRTASELTGFGSNNGIEIIIIQKTGTADVKHYPGVYIR